MPIPAFNVTPGEPAFQRVGDVANDFIARRGAQILNQYNATQSSLQAIKKARTQDVLTRALGSDNVLQINPNGN